jgi:hypothetical protein
MFEQTPADEFLSELADLHAMILDVLDSPRKAQWHWPSFYLLYVDMDRLAGVLTRVEYMFVPPFSRSTESLRDEEGVADDNALFALLDRQQKEILGWLFKMYRYTGASSMNPAAHARLGAHVHPKSGWYQTFMRDYRSGIVTPDGTALHRVALPVNVGGTSERINDITASCMLRRQSFDMSTPAARAALGHATDEARSRLGMVQAAMTAFLTAHCTLSDLLHPCSH